MNKLIKAIEEEQNVTVTHKGALSNASTLNSCLDLFGSIGSMRSRRDSEIKKLFDKAFNENPLKAMKIMFWVRDIRGGAGERKVFRIIMKYLAEHNPDIIRKNIELFPEYGRWDDLLCLLDTQLKDVVLDEYQFQFEKDIKAISQNKESISILGKWLPSENASSKETKRYATMIRKHIGLSSKQYRKTLSLLRKHIDIVERKMCENQWDKIVFEQVPSRASMIYRKAFKKHDEARYSKYLEDVSSGKKDIKTATLYPYDIVRKVYTLNNYNNVEDYDKTIDLQWKNLPNYVEPFNGLVICDTSGSMASSGYYGGNQNQVRPIDVSISLSIYIAERNTGIWKDYYIPFSSKAKLVKIVGDNIYKKVRNCGDGAMCSTNLKSAFNLILNTAITHNLSQKDMPEMLLVISDMQFDSACSLTNYQLIKNKYKAAGYEMPQLVFWNVNAYGDTPIKCDDNGTALISGCSPAILKAVLNRNIDPITVMDNVIETERYKMVTI